MRGIIYVLLILGLGFVGCGSQDVEYEFNGPQSSPTASPGSSPSGSPVSSPTTGSPTVSPSPRL